ncbi:UNVERIFIED_CONTAM: hypothetical protein PYX00_003518 [Menopon gallinae]|uniref:Ubiquitin-like domain-containing protein n=1 Tax=Menopon gallinae TaxID=328185 RepID=A0AAW2I1T5_9NEOP
MVSDDSLTEGDDSFFDLYSTQKITSTYNTVLEKLKSSKEAAKNEPGSDQDIVDVINDKCKVTEKDYIPSPKKTKSDEDEVSEIIIADDSPVASAANTRRSARLKGKGRVIYDVDSDTVPEAQPKRNARGNRRKPKKTVEVVEITDTNEEDNLNSSINDEMNYKVSVKVIWKSVNVKKNVLKFSVRKDEPLKLTMIRYAEQIETPLDKVKFYFDGEILSASDTPESLGLDNDEVIDVKIVH